MLKPIAASVLLLITPTLHGQGITARQAEPQEAPVIAKQSPTVIEIPLAGVGAQDAGSLADVDLRGIWIQNPEVSMVEKNGRTVVRFYGNFKARYSRRKRITLMASVLANGQVIASKRWLRGSLTSYGSNTAATGTLRFPPQAGALVLRLEIYSEE
jgi:hypothetical protein